MNEIYNMKLHDVITIGDYDIVRVPGGWIYVMFDKKYMQKSSVFVPYDNSFKYEDF